MKQSILALIATLMLSSCNLFSSSDKYGDNYREACRNLDFEAAHKILDKMTTKTVNGMVVLLKKILLLQRTISSMLRHCILHLRIQKKQTQELFICYQNCQ